MKDPDSNGGRLTNLARRWRKRLAQAQSEADSQETFFSPGPPAKGSSIVPMPAVPASVEEPQTAPELTADQAEALGKIEAAYEPGKFYLFTGHAGSGKSNTLAYLYQEFIRVLTARNADAFSQHPLQHPMPSRLRRAQEKTPSRPGSLIQIP